MPSGSRHSSGGRIWVASIASDLAWTPLSDSLSLPSGELLQKRQLLTKMGIAMPAGNERSRAGACDRLSISLLQCCLQLSSAAPGTAVSAARPRKLHCDRIRVVV